MFEVVLCEKVSAHEIHDSALNFSNGIAYITWREWAAKQHN